MTEFLRLKYWTLASWRSADLAFSKCHNLWPRSLVKSGICYEDVCPSVSKCFFQLRRLRRVRRLLGRDVTANLVAALVFSQRERGVPADTVYTGCALQQVASDDQLLPK